MPGQRVRIPDGYRTVHLQFRRFAGCPVCEFHLRSIVRRHDELMKAELVEVAVFTTPLANLAPDQRASCLRHLDSPHDLLGT